jgi:hypothetical protein
MSKKLSNQVQSASSKKRGTTAPLKVVKVQKKDVWRFRGSVAGSVDIDPLL